MTEMIIGADEVGYGCLAGPLVVCGVKAPKDWTLEGLNDSKKLSAKKREKLADQLASLADLGEIEYHIAYRHSRFIDDYGVAFALKHAYAEVFHELGKRQQISIIVDGILKFDNPELSVYDIRTEVKADTKVATVMAASIIAKVDRDDFMHTVHKSNPEYGWDKNVGYGSASHIEAIKKYGLSDYHRKSYKVKSIIEMYE